MLVYHLKDSLSGEGEPKFPEDYEFVAHASAAETLREALELTTHGKHRWYKGVFVQPADDSRNYRQTRPGDVIVDKQRRVWKVTEKSFKRIDYATL